MNNGYYYHQTAWTILAPPSKVELFPSKQSYQSPILKKVELFWKHDYEEKKALRYKREPILKISLQESHFGSLFFLSVIFLVVSMCVVFARALDPLTVSDSVSDTSLLPPTLAEEIMFSVAFVCVCVSVCTLQAEPLSLPT